jgi:uncharacterized protein with HEPN domain
VDAVERLIALGRGVPAGVLGSDRDTNEMVLWNLVVLGEAAKRLPPSVRRQHREVPWTLMAGVRDRVAHHYEGIDWEVIATIIGEELPVLLPTLITMRESARAASGQGEST